MSGIDAAVHRQASYRRLALCSQMLLGMREDGHRFHSRDIAVARENGVFGHPCHTAGAVAGSEDSLYIHAGGSQDHIAVIGEALARLDLTKEMEPFTELMRRERQNMADSYVTVCLISSGRSDAIIREAEAMARQQDGIFWICPLRKDEEDKQIPGSIDFRRMNI